MSAPIQVTVWSENRHEKINPKVAALYPEGIHGALAAALRTQPDLEVGIALLEDAEHGLSAEVLAKTDVLVWWGHISGVGPRIKTSRTVRSGFFEQRHHE
jgi:trehalose utilization protein